MAYRKATVMCVLGHNSSILARMQLSPRIGRSLIAEQSFDVRIVRIRRIVFELCLMEKKKKKERKKERKKEDEEQNRNFRIRFSQL